MSLNSTVLPGKLNNYPRTDVKNVLSQLPNVYFWYLTKTNVGLVFLDEHITKGIKEIIIQKLETKRAKK